MAYMELDRNKLAHNFKFLQKMFKEHNIEWSVVTKLLCGHPLYINVLEELGITEVSDSRLENLKRIKEQESERLKPIFIKPPALSAIPEVVRCADVSFNTELKTIRALSAEAKKQNRTHKIFIMLELGELREGVMRDEFLDVFEEVLKLPNIKVLGIAANFSCLYGVLPSIDKMMQLILYKELIKEKFDYDIEFVSAGSSVVIPMIKNNTLPEGINHFRVGETLFMGTDLYHDEHIKGMAKDIFTLRAEIIELAEKPIVPDGKMGSNVEGESFQFPRKKVGKTSYRAIVDLGLLDTDRDHIFPADDSIEIVGASSDMMVMDLKNNKNGYKLGDFVEFTMDYVGALHLLNSPYVEKRVKAVR